MTNLTNAQLRNLRSQLIVEKAAAEQRLASSEHYGLDASLRDESGDLSAYDNHPGDAATETYERGKDIALHEQEELHLNRINAALAAMEDGSYGTCRTCGEPIPPARLQALPDALYCVAHSPRQEVSDHRPIEESFLQPPFGRTSLDENEDGYTGFDGEDAWQIVESWGNSNSPAMSENREVTSYDEVGLEADEADGYVEPFESFVATDITGSHRYIVRNQAYDDYLEHDEGDHLLERD
ncbi:TraR/DksA C4-type zinc finger protein [Paenibacillus sacheonensis]|uniref:Molecular chaperone DnaK n=1 Tax=Paenibacillus sacheonensis TaxID=742054 RepID=A0A7X4YVG0_9BACL|nr:TraR/DksA C4-type zinc finger protein [Paenibacillus sacheonensis]MBM7565733.1 YteA family regulatory protein [Paenibacillus sacheonensis]NBC72209.1 molecular chaperone DnaK [Paenibacillus sacheonensis]